MTAYETPDAVLVLKAVEVLRSRLRMGGVNVYVSGIDGSGKTTLVQTLVEILVVSNIPVRRLHVYQWYLNITWAPILLLYNRYIGRKVLLFDRGIYDNISVLAVRQRCPGWLARTAISIATTVYPKASYHFYLTTTFSETIERRPDTCAKRFMALGKVYEGIASRVRCIKLQSDRHLFCAVLRHIAGEV